MTLTVNVNIGKDMQTREEIANALKQVAEQFLQTGKYTLPVVDTNGNRVGELTLK